MKVFAASAALAVVFAEPGSQQAERLLEDGDAVISSVNHAHRGAQVITADRLWKDLKGFRITLIR
ncbi:MAG TPA: hypothetical protein PKB14_15115 [Rubrivivax sp.]|nr:hypothetical protein [Rubrivivax sp.]